MRSVLHLTALFLVFQLAACSDSADSGNAGATGEAAATTGAAGTTGVFSPMTGTLERAAEAGALSDTRKEELDRQLDSAE